MWGPKLHLGPEDILFSFTMKDISGTIDEMSKSIDCYNTVSMFVSNFDNFSGCVSECYCSWEILQYVGVKEHYVWKLLSKI